MIKKPDVLGSFWLPIPQGASAKPGLADFYQLQ